ncbi:MAG TPA: NADPH-dependent assimilatory sulfite reductase hemoprotein subunit [Stellaceae bacterium]|nr:NADPH-dependent assimilatory sulfite reductase hemoprotein subunit [Stellaceae bacterium]
MKTKGAPSKVEAVKQSSHGLRQGLAAGLADPAPAFDDDGYHLLKFHGIYQGYDRDSATLRKQQGLDKEHQFMARVRIPGGRLTARQYLALDDLADRYANGTLRVTTRQSIQFHGVVKRELKETIASINQALLTTLAACGDVVRTVTTVAAPIRDAAHQRLEADARELSAALLPRTGAYHEIWLDGEQVTGLDEDALYGATFLPRKFKIGLALPEDNSVDVLTNDLALIALYDGERLAGYNIALGGGLGMTHNNPKTFPRLASLVAFIAPEDLVAAARAVVKLHRDHGDRSDRRHARLKYLIAERGEAWAKAELEATLGKPLAPPRAMPPFAVRDHLGWHDQGDGKLYLGIPVPSGRILDVPGGAQLKTALRALCRGFGVDPILTPQQDVILSNIAPADRGAIESLLDELGVARREDLAPVERWALACPALPTCGLALTEAERVRTPLLADIKEALAGAGLADEPVSVRITGCPNGCVRPYAGDIGIVGRMPGFYQLWVGGDFAGTRLSFPLLDRVPQAAIGDRLGVLFRRFAAERQANEGFGDFCHRAGKERLAALFAAPLKAAS